MYLDYFVFLIEYYANAVNTDRFGCTKCIAPIRLCDATSCSISRVNIVLCVQMNVKKLILTNCFINTFGVLITVSCDNLFINEECLKLNEKTKNIFSHLWKCEFLFFVTANRILGNNRKKKKMMIDLCSFCSGVVELWLFK